jgi:hypothetical protein
VREGWPGLCSTAAHRPASQDRSGARRLACTPRRAGGRPAADLRHQLRLIAETPERLARMLGAPTALPPPDAAAAGAPYGSARNTPRARPEPRFLGDAGVPALGHVLVTPRGAPAPTGGNKENKARGAALLSIRALHFVCKQRIADRLVERALATRGSRRPHAACGAARWQQQGWQQDGPARTRRMHMCACRHLLQAYAPLGR